jgi:hypothetical protein
MKLLLGSVLMILSFSAPAQVQESHGTINIIFANKNGLVALTDSMLSSSDNLIHSPNHQKLFRIDGKTICLMAGSYGAGGINENDPNFALWVPNIMNGFAMRHQARERDGKSLPFAMKFVMMKETFEHQLTANLQAYISADHPVDFAKLQPIELTLAGYDFDGALKVGEVTLTPEQAPGGVGFKAGGIIRNDGPIPACEKRARLDVNFLYDIQQLPQPWVPGDGLFCEVAGLLSGVHQIEGALAEAAENNPLPALQAYVSAERKGGTLSMDQLEALAEELEDQVAKQEKSNGSFLVGGDPIIAILRNGVVEKAPESTEVRPGIGDALNSIQFSDFGINCGGNKERSAIQESNGPDGPQMSLRVTSCQLELKDRVIYHDCHFTDSILTYSGNGPLRFARSNTVMDTTLKIEAQVDIQRSEVKDLMCNFPWKAVYHGEDEIHPACK